MAEIPINDHDTLNLGNPNAPHQLTVVMNLSCRYCKQWWRRNFKTIQSAMDAGRLALHIKFWTVNKPALLIGNIAHQFIDFKHPEMAFEFVKKLIQNQNDFKRYSVEAVPKYLQSEYGVVTHNDDSDIINTTLELKSAGVRGIPTIIIDGNWHDSYHYRLPEL
ncbi:DsbA family protein (plasmid) [Nicoliella spurrieriana]|uniref:DsbA family protein n=1 Tax=Nicoliella spurrieriana TaxID=2925830 RepID=A0A976RRA3_9LACO|nr:DsbA family protein [Nicoliella spurrieriana]UQS86181.1 DsbA family protein [Nicoliella spurrieriana]